MELTLNEMDLINGGLSWKDRLLGAATWGLIGIIGGSVMGAGIAGSPGAVVGGIVVGTVGGVYGAIAGAPPTEK